MKAALEQKLKLGQHREANEMIAGYGWDDPETTKTIVKFAAALMTGNGMMQNFDAGLPLLRRAADIGSADAMIELSHCYRAGRGVSEDHEKAFELLRKAGEAGHRSGQQWSAQEYDRRKEWNEAAVWWLQCANWPTLGSFPQRTLAERYRDGKGVPQDIVSAYAWANVACKPSTFGADNEAVKLRDALAKDLTPEQLTEGQRRSWEWQPGKSL